MYWRLIRLLFYINDSKEKTLLREIRNPFISKEVTVKDKTSAKQGCSICQCWYSGTAYHLVTTVFRIKIAHISCKAIGFKFEENANQIPPSYSGRPRTYLHFYLHPELTFKTPNTWPHLIFHTCQAWLHLYSLTCEAVGELQKLHSSFSPADVLIPMEVQDWPGKQGGNTELLFGAFCSGFLLPSPTETWCLE